MRHFIPKKSGLKTDVHIIQGIFPKIYKTIHVFFESLNHEFRDGAYFSASFLHNRMNESSTSNSSSVAMFHLLSYNVIGI